MNQESLNLIDNVISDKFTKDVCVELFGDEHGIRLWSALWFYHPNMLYFKNNIAKFDKTLPELFSTFETKLDDWLLSQYETLLAPIGYKITKLD